MIICDHDTEDYEPCADCSKPLEDLIAEFNALQAKYGGEPFVDPLPNPPGPPSSWNWPKLVVRKEL